MGNPVVHFEIGAADDTALQHFYSELFGWGLQPIPPGGYTLVDTRAGSGINGGIGRSSDGTPWAAFYVEAPDIQAVLDKAQLLGAKTVVPVSVVPDMVTWAMFSDPDGLLVGLVQSAPAGQPQEGPGPSPGNGAAIDWFEVLGSDGDRTRAFYTELFGWTLSGSGPYSFVDTGAGRGIGGGVGAGNGSRWATIYAHVADVERTLARAQELGGAREYGPNQVDDHMRTGAIRDPAGNVVGIYEHPEH
jgi:uncharacterized protein